MKNISRFKKIKFYSFFVVVLIVFSACDSKNSNKNDTKSTDNSHSMEKYTGKGIGPITELIIDSTIDDQLVNDGKVIFEAKCTMCHKSTNEKAIGPGLAGIYTRRTPEWIMNMILNPMEMTQKDSLAKDLLSVYMSQMADNNLTQAEARSVLEYLRTLK